MNHKLKFTFFKVHITLEMKVSQKTHIRILKYKMKLLQLYIRLLETHIHEKHVIKVHIERENMFTRFFEREQEIEVKVS